MDLTDLPDYSAFGNHNSSMPKGIDLSLYNIYNILDELCKIEELKGDEDSLEFWKDAIFRTNRYWSTGIAILENYPVEALIVMRSGIESACAIGHPYHDLDKRFARTAPRKSLNKTLDKLAKLDIGKYVKNLPGFENLVEASGSNRNWTLDVMNKATHTLPSIYDQEKELVSMEDLTNKLQSKVNAVQMWHTNLRMWIILTTLILLARNIKEMVFESVLDFDSLKQAIYPKLSDPLNEKNKISETNLWRMTVLNFFLSEIDKNLLPD